MLEVFDLESREWSRQATHGDIPYVGYSFSFALAGDFLFLFGGFTDVDYFDDLYRLDLIKFTWEKISTKGLRPSALTFSGMLYYNTLDGNKRKENVLVFGGSGPKPLTDSQHGYLCLCVVLYVSEVFSPSCCSCAGGLFESDQSFNSVFQTGWNNRIHKFDTKSGSMENLHLLLAYMYTGLHFEPNKKCMLKSTLACD